MLKSPLTALQQLSDRELANELERRGHRVVFGETHERAFGLTEEMLKVYSVVRKAFLTDRPCPSYDEIASQVGLKSRSGVHRIVKSLVERGALKRLPHVGRSLMPVDAVVEWPWLKVEDL